MQRTRFLIALAFASFASAQQPNSPTELFATVKPDITVVVKKHAMGSDMVEITMLNPKYPVELLKERIQQLGVLLNAEIRGIVVGAFPLGNPGDDSLTFVKGTFSTDGLMDIQAKQLKIQSVLRAFVGDPEPFAVRGFSIFFAGLQPDPRYVQKYDVAPVFAEARIQRNPIPGIEYRILVETNDPNKVEFPNFTPERKPAAPPSKAEGNQPVAVWIAIGAAALSAGALVYLAILRSGSKSSSRKG